MIALASGVLLLSGCKEDDNAGPGGPVTFNGSVYAFITQSQFQQATSNDPDTALDSLVTYLDKFPDLKARLSGTSELTLFAPSNTAFGNATDLPRFNTKTSQDSIKAVLTYLLVSGKKLSSDLSAGASIATMYTPGGIADVIKINGDGTLLTGSANDKIVIHTKDQLTTNGVVQTTEAVLIPNAIAFEGSIYDFITQSKFKQATSSDPGTALDSLVKYIDEFPELKDQLSGTTELTLFAPNNEAFKNLTALPGLSDLDRINPDIIKGILAYHIVAGAKRNSDLTTGTSIATMYAPDGTTDVIKINSDGTLLTGSPNERIGIHVKDQLTTNSVVHTTGTVLLPNPIGDQFKNILSTLAATVLLDSDFTYMAALITNSELTANESNSILAKLSDKNSKSTLLAIPNIVFAVFVGTGGQAATKEDVMNWINSISPDDARLILGNHILLREEFVDSSGDEVALTFTQGEVIEPVNIFSGSTSYAVTTGVPSGVCGCMSGVVLAATPPGTSIPIVQANIDTEAGISNGVMHVVGGIIITDEGLDP